MKPLKYTISSSSASEFKARTKGIYNPLRAQSLVSPLCQGTFVRLSMWLWYLLATIPRFGKHPRCISFVSRSVESVKVHHNVRATDNMQENEVIETDLPPCDMV